MDVKRVYGYIRVSTDTQAEKGYGLDTQRAAIEKYCKDNGIELVDVYIDKGITGAGDNEASDPLYKRPALVEMLASLNGTNHILVLNTSRLWRNDTAKVFIRREVLRAKGDIISIEQPKYSIYVKDPSDILISGIFEVVDEWERVSIALKLAKGRTTKARKGDKPAGVTPYGYRYSDDKKSVVISDEEAATVKRMFSLAQTGKSIQYIVDTLNGEGILTRQGKVCTKATAHGMLRNNFYTGVLTHRQTASPGNHEAIISKVQFGKVQNQLERRHK